MYRITFIQKMTYITLMIILLGCSKDADPVAEIDLTLKQQIAQKILAKTNTIRSENSLSALVQNDDISTTDISRR